MQEFSSISVSSYEAGALADQLTEQSRDGWSVVSIVPTGSTVTAYLSRAAGGSATTATIASVEPPADEPQSNGDAVADDAAASATADDGSDPVEADSPSSDDPATEAPGWAAGSTAAATPAGDSATDAPAADPASVATAAPASSPGADAGGAAPAGWYADPSSRFELRYWDGSQWTEHVSRAGQQYTDPPVA